MIEDLKTAKKILKKYNQEHLLNFYDELNDDEKTLLVKQICNIDFDKIFSLYEASKIDEVILATSIQPLSYITKCNINTTDFDFYTKLGSNCIANNNFAVVTMAGGQRYKAWV